MRAYETEISKSELRAMANVAHRTGGIAASIASIASGAFRTHWDVGGCSTRMRAEAPTTSPRRF